MNKILLSLLLLIAGLNNAFAISGVDSAGSIVVNPAANAVLTTTAALNSNSTNASPSANWVVNMWWTCSVSTTYEYQVLNTSSAVVYNMLLPCTAGNWQQASAPGMSFSVPNGFKLQIIALSGFTGNAQASILYGMENQNN
jgi:hypothetical protein